MLNDYFIRPTTVDRIRECWTEILGSERERFIQTAIREWAYARRYENSAQRLDELLPWTHQYNWHRPHSSLQHKPTITRSGLDVNKLLINHMIKRDSVGELGTLQISRLPNQMETTVRPEPMPLWGIFCKRLKVLDTGLSQ